MPILDGLGALSKPVMFGLHHEPEDEAGPPGMAPSDWVDMQTHAVSLAMSAAPNVGIVPILMQWTFDPRSGRDPQAWLVPSAPIFGLDVYNDWSPGDGLPWLSFGQKASMAVPYAHGKPIAIAEYGCHTDPSQPGRAASWMTDAFAWCTNNDVAAMSYYDSNLHSLGVVGPRRRTHRSHEDLLASGQRLPHLGPKGRDEAVRRVERAGLACPPYHAATRLRCRDQGSQGGTGATSDVRVRDQRGWRADLTMTVRRALRAAAARPAVCARQCAPGSVRPAGRLVRRAVQGDRHGDEAGQGSPRLAAGEPVELPDPARPELAHEGCRRLDREWQRRVDLDEMYFICRVHAGTITIADLGTLYADHLETKVLAGNIGQSTAEWYGRLFRVHVVEPYGTKRLVDVKPSDIERWLNLPALSGSTRRGIYLAARQALDMAVPDGLLPANPALQVKGPRPASTSPQPAPRARRGPAAQVGRGLDGHRLPGALADRAAPSSCRSRSDGRARR